MIALRLPDKIALAVLIAALVVTLLGPLVPLDGSRTVAAGFVTPGPGLWLGTDSIGRDVAARVLQGGIGLIAIALLATAISMLIGIAFGLLLSVRSPLTKVASAGLDIFLVIPGMLVMMVLIFGLGGGLPAMVAITTVITVPFVARFTRSLTQPMLDSEFVTAARAAGDSWPKVAVQQILPNLTGPLLTDAGARFVGALYMVAAAGFLGFNPLGGDGDWATMIQANLEGLRHNPWASLAPALAIALITIPANLLVDHFSRRSQL